MVPALVKLHISYINTCSHLYTCIINHVTTTQASTRQQQSGGSSRNNAKRQALDGVLALSVQAVVQASHGGAAATPAAIAAVAAADVELPAPVIVGDSEVRHAS
jgi:hypothetical protein